MSLAVAPSRNAAIGAARAGSVPAPCDETVSGAGTVSTGGVESTTLTENDTLLELPRESVALQLTEVVPSGKVAPGAGEHEVGSGPSTASTAVGDE
jgi:hypothetical protein